MYNKNRRLNKTHSISNDDWNRCLYFFDNSCAYCGMTMLDHKNRFNQSLHKEHVDSSGGNGIDNCVPSCKICNSSKWEFDMEEWYKLQEFFDIEKLEKVNRWIQKPNK